MKSLLRLTEHDPQRQQAKFGSCLLPCTESGLVLQASVVPSFVWEAYSVTALAVARALWLGDMPKRHVGYALTLSGIVLGFKKMLVNEEL